MNDTYRPLDGRVALITGAGRARGMGAATARHLARLGTDVVVTDLARSRPELDFAGVGLGDSMDAIEAIAADVRAEGVRSQAMALDITDAARSEAVIADVVSQFGRLDILVNNAGTAIGVGDFADVPDGEWELRWQVNVLGTTRLSRLAVPHLARHGHGAIVNVASTAGLIGIAGYGAYNVAKHGVVGLTRLLAAELGPRGISVEDATQAAVSGIPLGRLGTADDVAEVVAWLVSSAAYVTGTIIPIDGGSGR